MQARVISSLRPCQLLLCLGTVLLSPFAIAQTATSEKLSNDGSAVMELAVPALPTAGKPPAPEPSPEARPASVPSKARNAKKSSQAASSIEEATRSPRRLEASAGSPGGDTSIERVTFNRRAVGVSLAISRERQITFPNPIALQIPSTADGLLATQIIERTAYVRALAPFNGLRIIAEDLVTGQMVPLDLSAGEAAAAPSSEVEVFYAKARGPAGGAGADEATDDADNELDEVQLARFAAQTVYAPRRLIPATPGVRQVPVSREPISGLLRGVRVAALPLGQWRSGALYVTAVQVTNLQSTPVELDLRELRGNWRAAASQHARLLPAGRETDTSTLYLICERPFEACR